MACGACARSAAKKDCQYIYVDSKGQQTVYSSEVRAKAAKLRDGNVGSIRVEC